MTDSTTSDGSGPIERKVQVTGGSTYTVSIPKAWANAREISSGSIVYLYPFDDRLVVARPDGNGPVRRSTVNIDAVGTESLAGRIGAAYAAGADEIAVESDTGFSSGQRRQASRAITGLVGMEIASESDRELLAKSLLDTTEISLENTIDQLRQIALSMHDNAVETTLATDEEAANLADHVVERDDDVDRLFALVSRQFYRTLDDVREVEKLETGRRTAFTRFRIARQLERIADHAELVAEVGARGTEPPAEALRAEFRETAGDARRVVRTALDGNTGEALMHRNEVVEALDDLDRRLYESDAEDVYLYGRVLESIRRTAEYGGNIAEIITLNGIGD